MSSNAALKDRLRLLRVDIDNTITLRNSLDINAPIYFSRILQHLRDLEEELIIRIRYEE